MAEENLRNVIHDVLLDLPGFYKYIHDDTSLSMTHEFFSNLNIMHYVT